MSLAEVLPNVQKLPPLDKLKLIRILAEDLETTEDISPLMPHKVYYMPTPYDSYGAAEVLMNLLNSAH